MKHYISKGNQSPVTTPTQLWAKSCSKNTIQTNGLRAWYWLVRERYTLASHNETGNAVWDAGAGGQESDAHDDVRDSQCVANYSHLQEGK